ncbi:pentapeptide repeat-containing protein [Leisingera sp. M658]|uniref:pentapeptide repeat-containing protein n=1 Tax=Leisingera sp. M658 TaxID=2867015 RepID=UPI0021A7631A|nr:pentapeptide repeat-containing protein [Leisingera sp. M658]UWQ73302.1 pentapeptide repeat-containing protein [Leisingera sp. M658]
MKNDVTIEEVWPEQEIYSALEMLEEGDLTFTEMAECLDLQPECDFKDSNLTNTDFSYSDLRGFNFKGADLRNAYGMDVQVDQTTNLNGALVENSIFQNLVEERIFFEENNRASRIYEALKKGDPYEVSSWVSSRGDRLVSKKFKNISEEQASLLCKKLIVDDIDLTKRTTLFYYLHRFTNSTSDLHRVVSDFVAFHLGNPGVILSFVRVAGDVLSNDEFVAKTILSLCDHRDIGVKEAAFSAITKTPLFAKNYRRIRSLFFSEANTQVRKQIILKTAIKLGAQFVLSINTEGRSGTISGSHVLDFHEMLREETTLQVRASQGKRVAIQSDREIVERQQEVLAQAPVFSVLLERQGSDWIQAALKRSHSRRLQNQRDVASKVRHSFRSHGRYK